MGPVDEAAFRDYVTAHSPSLLRLAYLLTGDRGHAEDAVQSTLSRVYLAWGRIAHREALDSYCRRALVREVSSWRRRRRVTQVLVATPPERFDVTSDKSVEARDELRAALLQLPHQQRAVVVLRFYGDLSEADVAEVLGVSAGTVKQHTARAIARLRSLLEAPDSTIREST